MSPGRATAVAGVLAVVFAVLTVVVALGPRWLVVGVDGAVADGVRGWLAPHATGRTVLRVVTWAGHPLVVDAVVLVGAAVLWRTLGWAAAVALVANGLASLVVRGLVKTGVDRPRPVGGFAAATGGSFPSGHTAGAAFVGGAAVVLFARAWVALVASAYAVVIGATRVLLDVHWLSDVVGGLLLGATFALLVPLVRRRLGERLRVETLPE